MDTRPKRESKADKQRQSTGADSFQANSRYRGARDRKDIQLNLPKAYKVVSDGQTGHLNSVLTSERGICLACDGGGGV